MNEHNDIHSKDPAVRTLKESDIPAVINLYKLNWGNDYPYPQFYDEDWYKYGIYSDHIVWLVIEEDNQVVGSGAINLDYGDYNDQIGELGRVVMHPRYQRKGFARRIVAALVEATHENVEFAFGDARTIHPASQMLMESSNFTAVGFAPQRNVVGDERESFILYANLYGNGRLLRSDEPPQVIPEIAPLARQVLGTMGFSTALSVVNECPSYPNEAICTTQPMTRDSLVRLARIEHGRLVEPLLFGGVSLDQGVSFIRRRNAVYLMAMDENEHPVGAVGYQQDKTSQIVKGVELVALKKEFRGHLCGSLIQAAEGLGAKIIEVNVSAYDVRLQRTFAERGFYAVAYLPAMVFHGTQRLDVIKMLKLSIPYCPGKMTLTEKAMAIFSIVEMGFTSAQT